jgi:hypothetical protein
MFFAIVFVVMDDLEASIIANPSKAADWLGCLAQTGGDKNACLKFASNLVINEATVMAVLVLLSVSHCTSTTCPEDDANMSSSQLNGIWSLLFLGRYSMFTGWYEMFMGRVKPNNEFVSADVHTFKDPRSYEMLGRDRDTVRTPEPLVLYPITPLSPLSPPTVSSGRETPDYFGREARYKPDTRSFTNPKPPAANDGWYTSPTASPQPCVYPGLDSLSMNKI